MVQLSILQTSVLSLDCSHGSQYSADGMGCTLGLLPGGKEGCEAHCCAGLGQGQASGSEHRGRGWGMAQDAGDLEGSGRHLQLSRAHIMAVTGRAGTETGTRPS